MLDSSYAIHRCRRCSIGSADGIQGARHIHDIHMDAKTYAWLHVMLDDAWNSAICYGMMLVMMLMIFTIISIQIYPYIYICHGGKIEVLSEGDEAKGRRKIFMEIWSHKTKLEGHNQITRAKGWWVCFFFSSNELFELA